MLSLPGSISTRSMKMTDCLDSVLWFADTPSVQWHLADMRNSRYFSQIILSFLSSSVPQVKKLVKEAHVSNPCGKGVVEHCRVCCSNSSYYLLTTVNDSSSSLHKLHSYIQESIVKVVPGISY